MGGAAYLSALAAYRTGAGLVKILTPRENCQILQTLLPEAILSAYDREEAMEEPESFALQIERECGWADAVVLGPGLGKRALGSAAGAADSAFRLRSDCAGC